MSTDLALRTAILESLDGLLKAFDVEPLGDDRFRVRSEPARFTRVFGGQTLAQALLAAGATVTGKQPGSLHACFVRAGTPGVDVDLRVDRVRDGRSVATRHVSVLQGDQVLLTALVTFQASGEGVTPPLSPTLPLPGDEPALLPLLQHWAGQAPPEFRPHSQAWIDQPPPLEMRLSEPPVFMGGTPAPGNRSHWMRLPRDIGDDPGRHTALLVYASDYFLLDMAFRSYPPGLTPDYTSAVSLDHAIWLHGPVRLDRWHRHTQEAVVVSGHRGLVRGSIHDLDGNLVATVAQEVLVRPAKGR